MPTPFIRRLAKQLSPKYFRFAMNLWPPFLGTGIKVKSISKDFRHIETSAKLRWHNKNFVGTHFGGTLFAMTDAFYMIMLIFNLGENYIVWDKAANIHFKKPGRSTIFATFQFSEQEIDDIRAHADREEKYIFDRTVDVIDSEGNIIASVVKTIYVRRKNKSSTK